MIHARRQIEVTKAVKDKIKAVFKCSDVTVYRALNYSTESYLSTRIQQYAMLSGGALLLTTPAAETIHDADGFMRQYFGNGAMLEADKMTGVVRVYDADGTMRGIECECTIPSLGKLQALARSL